jgi:hypothetical protein
MGFSSENGLIEKPMFPSSAHPELSNEWSYLVGFDNLNG